jgi:predicted tellurium resistance membrane protein TerC
MIDSLFLASYLDFSWFQSPEAWGALLTLSLLEIVLGIDNIIFISILVDRLPEKDRKMGRYFGLGLAMIARLILLASITWIMSMKNDVFSIPIHPYLVEMLQGNKHEDPAHALVNAAGMMGVSVKDIILILGGFFLIWKSTKEIHHKVESVGETAHQVRKAGVSLASVLIQVTLIDLVFSLDSVITAVGMVNDPSRISLMMCAVVISIAVMLLASGTISNFVSRHPSVKILALAFLILIGTTLLAEGVGFHVPKGYIYFAMAFSFAVELINLRIRKSAPNPEI